MFGLEGVTPDIFLVFTIILLTAVLFVSEIVRVDMVAFLILVLLGLTQLVPSDVLFSGFSSDAVISLIAIMIISAGLDKAGVMHAVTNWVLRFGGNNENRINLLLMFVGGIFSGFMRSVGTVALFLPVIVRVRRRTGIAKARLLMPVGFCAILGSTLTMVGTGPLILLNSLLESLGALHNAQGEPVEPFGLFVVFPVGFGLLIVGMLYFIVAGRFILPKIPRKAVEANGAMEYFQRTYGVGGDFCELRVPPSSALDGNTLQQWENLIDPGINIIGIRSGSTTQIPPLRPTVIKQGYVVAVLGHREKVKKFAEKYGLKMAPYLTSFIEYLNPAQAGLCEAVVPPSSGLVGQDFKHIHMRNKFDAQVLALHRGGKVKRGIELQDITLRAGDTLGMFCEWRVLSEFEKHPDFVVVTTDYPKEIFESDKFSVAILFACLTLLLLIFSSISAPISLLIGAIGMIFSNVLSIDEAYESVSWKTVFLLAGLIPLGVAVQTTGAAALITSHFLDIFSNSSTLGIEIVLAVLATLFSLVMSNVGAAVLLVPLGVQIAGSIGADPRFFALIIAIASSNSFLIPTHQANALISGPGRYKVLDFIKAGSVITVIYWIVMLVVLHLIF